MKTVIIGGGKGGQALIELASGSFLKELTLDIQCVVDPDLDAPGMLYARTLGLRTSDDFEEALSLPGIELVIELTGQDKVLAEINRIVPPGIRVIDHIFARIFWDLVNAQEELSRRLQEVTALEREIERERRFLQVLFDTIPELVVVLSKEKRAIKVNASFANFAGITTQEALDKTCEQLLANTSLRDRGDEVCELIDSVLRTGTAHTVVWRTSGPEETYWEVTRTPITNEQGETEAVMATWHRITEQVMLRREIVSAEQRFRSFIDSAHDWISIKDLEGRYVIVNPAIAQTFGYEVEDFIGRTPAELLPQSMAQTIKLHDGQVIRDNSHHTYDEIIPVEGQDHHFQTVRFPLTDYKGETVGICTIARDVTSEYELRDQLVQAEKLAAVGKLAAGVAHEINNPLTGILAYAEDMLEDVPESDPHHSDLEVIVRETLRCRDIVRNLLDFARQEKLHLQRMDPNIVVEQALSLIQRLPQFRNITIERKLSGKVRAIECDPQHIQQVILNLMLNAADAMEGSGTVKVGTSYDRRQNRSIISVEDSGTGIPENLIDKIFEPFFSTKGTNGLGLAVSWGIVERHRGVIEVDTAESGGAIFRIVLPAVE